MKSHDKDHSEFQALKSLAEQGDVESMVLVADRYDSGRGVAADVNEALRWYKRSADAGSVDGTVSAAIFLAGGLAGEQDLDAAKALYTFAADLGDKDAIEALERLSDDPTVSVRPLLSEAERGNPGSMVAVAERYQSGSGVEKSAALASEWEARAQSAYRAKTPALIERAERGDNESMFELATWFEKGLGVAQDLRLALRWYERSADAGHSAGAYCAAVAYELGRGVAVSRKRAQYHFQLSSDLGDPEAQYDADRLSNDPKVIFEWARKHSALGDEEAMFQLARCFEQGVGTAVDLRKSLSLFEDAAVKGLSGAAFNAAILYEDGVDGSPNLTMARRYFELARDLGSEAAAQELQRISSRSEP